MKFKNTPLKTLYQVLISRMLIKKYIKHTKATQRPLKHSVSQIEK